MATWNEPVFDRTEEDVAFAKEQIQKWIDDVLTGNPVETYDLKGCLNLSDINRIEGNIQYLSDKLDELQYVTGTSNKTWKRDSLPTRGDIRRILSNLKAIIDAYHQQKGTAALPDNMATYSEINAIEENLYNIKVLLDAMIMGFPKSGTFQSGSMRVLPIRR